MNDDNMYYNIETDSFIVQKNYLLTVVMDQEKLDSSIRSSKSMMRKLVAQNQLLFKKDGTYTSWFGQGAGENVSGLYHLDEDGRVIRFLQETKEKVEDKMKYRLYDDQLEIKLINNNSSQNSGTGPAKNELMIIYKKVNQF